MRALEERSAIHPRGPRKSGTASYPARSQTRWAEKRARRRDLREGGPRRRGRKSPRRSPRVAGARRDRAARRRRPPYACDSLTMSESPWSMTASMEQLKYLPQAVPRSLFVPL